MTKLKLKKGPRILLITFIVFIILLILFGIINFIFCLPVDSSDKKDIEVVIKSGTGTKNIADTLKKDNLIRSEAYFFFYVKFHRLNSLKASTYTFNRSMNLKEIVSVLNNGNNYNENNIKITFKEGERITDYALEISNNTNHTYEEVISTLNDKVYINELINKYWFLTSEILNEDIYYPLEGYLAPDTYQFSDKDVSIKKIVEVMLDQTDKVLSKYKNSMTGSIHNYITMASIVELEGTNTTNRKMIVGVFNNRLKANMNLGSDVTTYYALQYPMTSDLTTAQFATINPYNTRASNMEGKLPIGPICNFSLSAIEASINPSSNDYYYFVADKKGKIYYSKTISEHEKIVSEIKARGDWIW